MESALGAAGHAAAPPARAHAAIHSHSIVGHVLEELRLSAEQVEIAQRALERMVSERAQGNGPAVLTNPALDWDSPPLPRH